MSNTSKCHEIRKQVLACLHHDLGRVTGPLVGYTDIFSSIQSGEIKWDAPEVTHVIESVRSSRVTYLATMDSFVDFSQYVSINECESELADLAGELERITQMNCLEWFNLLDKLLIDYQAKQKLDPQIITQMKYHATEIATFKMKLVIELHADFS